ncbi:MAG: hypothetical protein ACOVO2_17655, partial [Emticicia sp.]|uniref:hypothetical protein n=1 Tax=Emticicia sp. TaxID=1930953 RepID=UPI003BA5B516
MKTYFLVLLLVCLFSLGFNFPSSTISCIKQEINFPFRGQDMTYEKKYTFIKTDSLSIFEMHAFTGVDDPNGGTVQILKDTINYFCWKGSKGLIYHPFFQENRSIEILTNPDSVVNTYVGGFPQMEIREKDYQLESVKDSLGLSKRLIYSLKSNEHFMSPDTIKLLLIKEKYELYHSFSKKIEAEHGMTLTDVRFIFNAKKHENKDYPKLEGYLTLRKVEIKENAFLSAVLKQFEID